MAGLYNGFNALGLGSMAAQNDERRRAHNSNILELLRNFGNSAAERLKENRQRDKALATAQALGIDNAEGLSKGMDYADFARFVQGVASAKESEKISDARQQKQWGREDLVRADDRRYNEGQEAKKRSQDALDKAFATHSQAYLADKTKMRDTLLPSQADIDESAQIEKNLINFVKKHPEYAMELTETLMQAGKGGKPVQTIESRRAELDALEKDGVVDPKAMQAFKEKLINENVWGALNEDKNWQAKWNLLAGKIVGDELARDALMLGSGKVATESDAKGKKDKADHDALVKAENEKMEKWYNSKDPNEKPYDFSKAKSLGITIPKKYENLNNKRKRKHGQK